MFGHVVVLQSAGIRRSAFAATAVAPSAGADKKKLRPKCRRGSDEKDERKDSLVLHPPATGYLSRSSICKHKNIREPKLRHFGWGIGEKLLKLTLC